MTQTVYRVVNVKRGLLYIGLDAERANEVALIAAVNSGVTYLSDTEETYENGELQ